VAPNGKAKEPVRCEAFENGTSCKEKQDISYISNDCGGSCTGWEKLEILYKEEYKREVADNHIYYGNKDVSQEEVFYQKDNLSPKRPPFLLPSYLALDARATKSPTTPGKPDADALAADSDELLPCSPQPTSPASASSGGSTDSLINTNAVFSSHNETWQKRRPKGHGRTIRHDASEK
jgi:hypothetical protein